MNPATLISIIALAESMHGIPSGLLVAVCQVESELNPYAVVERDGKGSRDSIGICQLQLRTARHFSESVSHSELHNPVINANIAGAYLRFQFERYGDWERAVVAYNRGSSNGGGTDYSRKVMSLYGRTKRCKDRAYRSNQGRGNDPHASRVFFREDYAHATEDWTNL